MWVVSCGVVDIVSFVGGGVVVIICDAGAVGACRAVGGVCGVCGDVVAVCGDGVVYYVVVWC